MSACAFLCHSSRLPLAAVLVLGVTTACGSSKSSKHDGEGGAAGSGTGGSQAGGGADARGGTGGVPAGGQAGASLAGTAGRTGGGGSDVVYSACPESPNAQGARCEGDFVCSYSQGCNACGMCCSSGLACTAGVIRVGGFNDGCVQPCPSNAGSSGSAGSSGTLGMGGSGAEASGAGGAAGADSDTDFTVCGPIRCPIVTQTAGELIVPPTDESLRCVLQHLHDRDTGVYVQRTTSAGLDTQTTFDTVYLVKPDGSVHRVIQNDTGYTDTLVCELQPASAYDACLASVASTEYATEECRNTAWAINCARSPVSCE